jgi:hypothetical protein
LGKSKKIFEQIRQAEVQLEGLKERLPDWFIDQQLKKKIRNENPKSKN